MVFNYTSNYVVILVLIGNFTYLHVLVLMLVNIMICAFYKVIYGWILLLEESSVALCSCSKLNRFLLISCKQNHTELFMETFKLVYSVKLGVQSIRVETIMAQMENNYNELVV